MVRRGMTGHSVGKALGVTGAYVYMILNGQRFGGPGAQRVREYIAKELGLPVEVVFPEVVAVTVTIYRRKEPAKEAV